MLLVVGAIVLGAVGDTVVTVAVVIVPLLEWFG